ncbi:MAG: PhnD/SsuA/transferrin family substrate-binding protein [Candidatus Binatia bacterium]
MPSNQITLACRNYDGVNAILRGQITMPGIELRPIEMVRVADIFAGLYKGQYDVSEMSFAELVYYTSRNQCDFIGIPVFPSRVFRHSFLFCRSSSDIRGPEDLNGKKLGFLRWVQTAATWMRGMLVDEYGISPKSTNWYVASMHHWDDGHANEEITPRDGSVIRWIEAKGSNVSERSYLALAEGEIDALGVTENQLDLLQGDKRIKRVFENYQEEEASYFKKTRIMPIMHILAIRKSVVKQHPDLPEKLFKLFCQSKKLAQEWMRTIPSLTIAWRNEYLEKEREIFHEDPWAYGLEKNRHLIEKFLSYCHAQGISDQKISPEDLFEPSTWSLTE